MTSFPFPMISVPVTVLAILPLNLPYRHIRKFIHYLPHFLSYFFPFPYHLLNHQTKDLLLCYAWPCRNPHRIKWIVLQFYLGDVISCVHVSLAVYAYRPLSAASERRLITIVPPLHPFACRLLLLHLCHVHPAIEVGTPCHSPVTSVILFIPALVALHVYCEGYVNTRNNIAEVKL